MDTHQPPDAPASNQKSPSTPNHTAAPLDRVCWRSPDGLVVIKQLVKLAQKYPPSDYPCVVIQATPKAHERIRQFRGQAVELMLTYQEVEQFLNALNAAAETQGKGKLYQVLQHIAPKPQWRKQRWKRFNQRWAWAARRGLRKRRMMA